MSKKSEINYKEISKEAAIKRNIVKPFRLISNEKFLQIIIKNIYIIDCFQLFRNSKTF